MTISTSGTPQRLKSIKPLPVHSLVLPASSSMCSFDECAYPGLLVIFVRHGQIQIAAHVQAACHIGRSGSPWADPG